MVQSTNTRSSTNPCYYPPTQDHPPNHATIHQHKITHRLTKLSTITPTHSTITTIQEPSSTNSAINPYAKSNVWPHRPIKLTMPQNNTSAGTHISYYGLWPPTLERIMWPPTLVQWKSDQQSLSWVAGLGWAIPRFDPILISNYDSGLNHQLQAAHSTPPHPLCQGLEELNVEIKWHKFFQLCLDIPPLSFCLSRWNSWTLFLI